MQDVSVLILAAGNATRMEGINKQMMLVRGMPVVMHSVLLCAELESVCDIVLVIREQDRAQFWQMLQQYPCEKPVAFAAGGATRQDSVLHGLQACSRHSSYIAIHDGARPLLARRELEQVLADAKLHRAATLGVPAKDTIKLVDESGLIQSTPPREQVYLTQTPQVFEKALYRESLEKACAEHKNFTDDCQLVENMGISVYMTKGSYRNLKITTPEDELVVKALAGEEHKMRIGHGYDVHKLVKDRKLIIGGTQIPHTLGLLGHSDADVLLHAVMDALLGAAALGDIGKHFPDTDERFRGADSMALLRHVTGLLEEQGYCVGNIDCTVIAQQPKLAGYISQMQQNIAQACKAELSCVNVKATTEEKLGFTGECLGISAHAVALIEQK